MDGADRQVKWNPDGTCSACSERKEFNMKNTGMKLTKEVLDDILTGVLFLAAEEAAIR